MATTTNKGIEKPTYQQYALAATGWTDPINDNWDLIDNAFAGTYAPSALSSSSSDITLTQEQCQNIRIKFTGNVASAKTVNVFFPSGVAGMFIVDNATTGPFTINLKSAAVGAVEFVEAVQNANTFIWVSTDAGSPGVYLADNSPLTQGTGIVVSGTTVSLATPVSVANGGTGAASYTAGQLLIGNNAGGLTAATLTQGSNITITNGDGAITISASGSAGGVTTFSAGTTGFSPSVATAGAVTLSGTLATSNGGTGLTTFSNSNRAIYSTSASALTAGTLPVAAGGTGATSESTARTSLGLGSSNNVTFNTVYAASGATTGFRVGNVALYENAGFGGYNMSANTSLYGNNTEANLLVNSTQSIFRGLSTGATTGTFTLGSGISAFKDGGGTWSATSDARTKKDELPYLKGLNDLKTLNLVSYKYNGMYGTSNNDVTYYGLIAQEVLSTPFSDMVGTYVYTDPQTKAQTQLYSVDSSQLVYALINAVKELSNRVTALEARLPA